MRRLFQAQVKNGRLVLDEPTDLPEGEVVHLLVLKEPDEGASEQECAAFERALERSISQLDAGERIPVEALLEKMRARRT